MKIHTKGGGAQFFRADGQTGMTMLTVAFRNFADTPIQAKEI
jgi:hypothetical protein